MMMRLVLLLSFATVSPQNLSSPIGVDTPLFFAHNERAHATQVVAFEVTPVNQEMKDADERTLCIALSMCAGIEPATRRKLVRGLGSASAVWNGAASAWRQVCRMAPDSVERLDRWRNSFADNQIEAHLLQRGIYCLFPDDLVWPKQLEDLADPPDMLFVQGRLPEDEQRWTSAVAIVGTRRASAYGLEATRWIAETLARAGCEVVSGLALGIDGAAHRAALDVHGHTGAVLACGVDVCYPSSHRTIYEKICQSGWVITEYAPGSAVAKYRFPERNRLIAALSAAVIVVQAGERSGALRTAEAALDVGRDVYVVPGPITSVHFRGSHRLLQDGARILIDPVDFLTDYRMSPVTLPAEAEVPDRWQPLYHSLDRPATAAQLQRQAGLPLAEVFAGLLELELAGFVRRDAGGLYQRARP